MTKVCTTPLIKSLNTKKQLTNQLSPVNIYLDIYTYIRHSEKYI